MDLSRRGFLRKIVEVAGIGTGALIASKLPRLPEEEKVVEEAVANLYHASCGFGSASCVQMSEEERKLIRYWELKEYLGSKEYDMRIGFNGYEDSELWMEYYELCDYFGALDGEPRVRMIGGRSMVLDPTHPNAQWKEIT